VQDVKGIVAELKNRERPEPPGIARFIVPGQLWLQDDLLAQVLTVQLCGDVFLSVPFAQFVAR
jgi:hypothetical protein